MLVRFVIALAGAALWARAGEIDQLRRDFQNPPVDTRPHTRWWWMGNAMRKEDIAFQLSQMKAQGIGGVEQVSMQPVYEKGNVEYLSQEYFELVKYAIAEAKARGMEFSLNFGGPGWIWGGEWVPKKFRNRNMVASSVVLEGPRSFTGELPLDAVQNPRNLTASLKRLGIEDDLVSVVAARENDGVLEESSLTELTARVKNRRLSWQVPAGRWRVMAFWSVLNGEPAVDHLSREAMEFYCKYIGDKYRTAFGDEFGKTVESMFMDSFEVPVYRNGFYWTPSLPESFEKRNGYSLLRYLPAVWWDVDRISPKVRYDINETLHHVGMEAFFATFTQWCERNGVKARIQPYGFVTDILEGAGAAHIPELEITAGEKDAVPWFDTRIGPRIYTASGAHLYGRKVISAEAYTYMHWQQGRDTLEELKIASDIFLRAGATKFYNHGYTGTPEMEFVPSRRFGAEMIVSHVNTWWPYYHLLSDYVARASAALRFGKPVADIAVYSPLANQWTHDVLNARRWTRDFDWGELAKFLLSNGYDFDLINDDVLAKRANVLDGRIAFNGNAYRVLVLPNIQAMPLETLRRIEEFVHGGGVVIATDRLPSESTGMRDHVTKDAEFRSLAEKVFKYATAHFIPLVIGRTNVLDWQSSAYDPFVNTIRKYVKPDFSIDFVRHAMRENNGLVFSHRTDPDGDVYFVSNVQDRPVDMRVGFRVTGKAPQRWNPYTGQMHPLYEYETRATEIVLPVRLAPFESTFFVFSGASESHASQSDFVEWTAATTALAARNGAFSVDERVVQVEGVPAPYQIAGPWRMNLAGHESTVTQLRSWTEDPATEHFSGSGTYSAQFKLPGEYAAASMQLRLTVGDVGNVAEVAINGQTAGVIWMRDQQLDITKLAHAGTNEITIKVTNTLINRVSGWSSAPPLAADLAAIYGRGLSDNDPQFRRVYGFAPLPRSGLLGPVTITPYKAVELH